MQVADECGTMTLCQGRGDDVELRLQTIINIMIVFDGVAKMKNYWLEWGHGVGHGSSGGGFSGANSFRGASQLAS